MIGDQPLVLPNYSGIESYNDSHGIINGLWEVNGSDDAQLTVAKDLQLQSKDILSDSMITISPDGTEGLTIGMEEGTMTIGSTQTNLAFNDNLVANFLPSSLGVSGLGWGVIWLRDRVDLTEASNGAGIFPIVKFSTKSGGGSENLGPFPSGINKSTGNEFYNMWGNSTGFTIFGGGVNEDNYRRFRITSNGKHYWGAGNAAVDWTFARGGTTWCKFEQDLNDDVGIGIDNQNAGAGANSQVRFLNQGTSKWSIGNDAGNTNALTIANGFRMAGNEVWWIDHAAGHVHRPSDIKNYWGDNDEVYIEHTLGGMSTVSTESISESATNYIFTSSSGTDPQLRWQQNHNGNLGISLRTVHNSASPAAFDIIWKHDIRGKDDESAEISYGFIQTSITDPDGDDPTAEHHMQFNEVTIGDGTNDTVFASNGDLSFAGTAGFYPRRIRQAAIPAAGAGATQIDTGEMLIWEDSDDDSVHLVYNDTTAGIKSIALS